MPSEGNQGERQSVDQPARQVLALAERAVVAAGGCLRREHGTDLRVQQMQVGDGESSSKVGTGFWGEGAPIPSPFFCPPTHGVGVTHWMGKSGIS